MSATCGERGARQEKVVGEFRVRAVHAICGERGAQQEKVVGESRVRAVHAICGERGAQQGGVPGPALSVRPFVGHALPTEKSPIPELLSEGGSKSRSRLTVTVRGRGFVPVALVWRGGKRALKTRRVLGCEAAPRQLCATRSS
jgi:hypothetical protein